MSFQCIRPNCVHEIRRNGMKGQSHSTVQKATVTCVYQTDLLEFCYFASKMLIVKGKELHIFNQSVLNIKCNSDKNI